jgi:hypothetical protein
MINKVGKIILPLALGALGGFLYYNFVGCNGRCAITSNPYNSVAYGVIVGAVLTDWKTLISLFKNKGSQNEKEHGND